MEGGKSPKKSEVSSPEKADETGKIPGPFDVRTVKALVTLMTQHDLSEIELRDGEQRLRLRRGAYQAVTPSGAQPASHVEQTSLPAAIKFDAPVSSSPARQLIEIK